MPAIASSENLISKAASAQNGEYLLVVIDKKTNQQAYGYFQPSRFVMSELDVVHHLFDDTLRALSHPSVLYFADQELPILSHITQNTITIIERGENGEVSVRDGSGAPVESRMGLE